MRLVLDASEKFRQQGPITAPPRCPLSAEAHGNNYGMAMALVVGTAAVLIVVLVVLGPERRGIAMNAALSAMSGLLRHALVDRGFAGAR